MMTFLLLFTLIFACYLWLRKQYSYFEKWQLPYLPSSAWTPLGHLRQLLFLRISFGDWFQNIYADSSLKQAKVAGFFLFQTPALMVRDPELIRRILIKDFNSFLNRYEAADAQHDALGYLTLPLAKYGEWRESRQSMSQLFTSGRLKQRMYPLMLEVISDLEHYLERHVGQNTLSLGVSEMCQLYTTDVTGKLFYSWNVGGLRRDHSQLRHIAKDLFKPNIEKVAHFMTIFFLPQWTSLLRAKVFSKNYAQFMRKLVKNPELDHQGDLIDQLKQLQSKRSATHFAQHEDFIASQAGIILLAGFETSSALLGFTLYELAQQQNLQRRLRVELKEAFRDSSSLIYETLINLPYMKMVCLEALRLYPAAAFINRECTAAEGFDLRPHVDFVIPPGMPAYISILGLHRDAKYWPQPLLFDPERFSPENRKNIVQMAYLPFGLGPHNCIGSRLGLLQLKLGLAHILRLYRVEFSKVTVPRIRFNPQSFMLESKDEIYLKFCWDKL